MKTKNHSREEKLQAFARLLDIQERLRTECPWDRKQTCESLRPYTIEEVYELSDALLQGDVQEICKELGDVLEHIVFYAKLAEEQGQFDIADVCDAHSDKLMYRHDFIDWNKGGTWRVVNPEMEINPAGQVIYRTDEVAATHANPTTASAVEASWEQRKQREHHGNETVLSGVPTSLPSLIKAVRIQEKARNVGFDWKNRRDVWQKVREELNELEAEFEQGDAQHAQAELGDVLFSLVNAARLYQLNPDSALEQTNQKFIRRFSYVEAQAKAQGRALSNLSLEEMDALWDEAKRKEEK